MTPAIHKAPLPPAVAPWKAWNTPQTLRGSIYLIWALDALLLIAAIVGAQVHRDAMKAVGRDTAPSIIHAQHIKTALADMDANAANELLGEPGKMPEAVMTYETRRKEAATALIGAAKNITFDDRGKRPIEAIQIGLGTYEVLVQKARDLHERKDPLYLNAYHDGAKLMDGTLLPEADRLDQDNHDELESSYSALSTGSVGTVVFLLVAGASLLWALFAVQKFLNEKTHRMLNPLLVAATLIALWFVFYSFSTFGSERHRLKVAKEDAFTSIHALLRAEAVAYAANADESRYLLDASHASEHEAAFSSKANSLITLPPGTTFADAVNKARDGDVKNLKGFLADELNNITFEGERELAVKSLEAFGEYLRIDGEIRQFQQAGKHPEALELCIGTKPGQSNWAFDQFDNALKATVAKNQEAFDNAVERGFAALYFFELKASIVAAIIALLAFFGLLKRIQEYQ